ncbi:TadE/TadG family type IV pilus assembly protein [Ollibium composti]|uniref:Pilus assembly protein n=1 Tax=Ollibium composti TaxID=2675109 RepID=A0ABY2Q667_9HYPH|nr:TadE/TadG family type IV pilus assembly protein [Mesorhizobium composti]THF55730.1 pilus assembly protein [Mesorhizobium composti]
MDDTSGRPNDRKTQGKGLLVRFAQDRRGVTAIEFGLLGSAFFALVFVILESCVSFASQEVMVNATDTVARQLRTGQVKKADATEDWVKQQICNQLSLLAANNCLGRIHVDLRTFTTFHDAAELGFEIAKKNGRDGVQLTKLADGQKVDDEFKFLPGTSMTKNMLRVFYEWPVMTDYMALQLSNLNDTDTLHFASAIWQNEPFND